MSSHNSVDRVGRESELKRVLTPRQILRFALYVTLMPAVLFISSGRLDWGMAWAFAIIAVVFSVVSRVAAARRHPDLLAERAQTGEAEGTKSWDRVLVPIVALYGPLAILIVAGLDKRFGWSPPVPLWLQIAALLVVVLAYLVSTWAMVVNRFFSALVRVQAERGHTVVDSGPYRFVRHPAYSTGLVAQLAMCLVFGSLWSLIPAALTVVAIVVRTALEDRTLIEELPGYADYTRRVRYRLLPGIW